MANMSDGRHLEKAAGFGKISLHKMIRFATKPGCTGSRSSAAYSNVDKCAMPQGLF